MRHGAPRSKTGAFMSRSLRRVTTFAWAPMLTIGLVWGCAQSGVGDVSLESDPSLPEVDASWTPSPETPSEKVPSSSGSWGDDASGSEEEETPPSDPPPTSTPPSKAADPDAGAPDSGSTSSSGSGSKPTQGEVLITEVMYDPTGSEPANEWIEVHNRASSARTLTGLTIVDGGDRAQIIGTSVTIAPGAYVILARSKSAAVNAMVPASAIVYEYGAGVSSGAGIQLANGASGGVSLRDGTTIIAQAAYGGWFSQSGGSSIQLKTLTYPASLQSSNWCLSSNAWTAGSENGTPGAASDCP